MQTGHIFAHWSNLSLTTWTEPCPSTLLRLIWYLRSSSFVIKIIYYSHWLTNSDMYILWLYSPPFTSLSYPSNLLRKLFPSFYSMGLEFFSRWLPYWRKMTPQGFSHSNCLSTSPQIDLIFLHHLSLYIGGFNVEIRGWLLLPPFF